MRRTGYGAIEMQSVDRVRVLDCGIIANKPDLSHSECLRRLYGGMEELVKSFQPDCVAMEEAFYGKNVKTSMILSMARGAIIAAFAGMGIPVYTYSPRKAKLAAVGNGNATKTQVATMMAARFAIDIKMIPDDATDALALALCHGQIAVVPSLTAMLPKPV